MPLQLLLDRLVVGDGGVCRQGGEQARINEQTCCGSHGRKPRDPLARKESRESEPPDRRTGLVPCPSVVDVVDAGSKRSGEQPGDGVGLDQLAGLVEVVEDDRGRVDAEGVVDRGQQLAGVDRVGERGGAGLVRLAVDVAAADARRRRGRPCSNTASGRGRRRCCRCPRC